VNQGGGTAFGMHPPRHLAQDDPRLPMLGGDRGGSTSPSRMIERLEIERDGSARLEPQAGIASSPGFLTLTHSRLPGR
jgi:hypothetical protein